MKRYDQIQEAVDQAFETAFVQAKDAGHEPAFLAERPIVTEVIKNICTWASQLGIDQSCSLCSQVEPKP